MRVYKVVEQKQTSFVRGKLTADQLENLINRHASAGWALDRIVAGETARFMGMGDKDVFLLIFKNEFDGVYVQRGDEREGPLSADELRKKIKAGEITKKELCWHEGLDDWQPIVQVFPWLF